jgi:hypothetical protein
LDTLTRSNGVYALCDLDDVVLYVGQTFSKNEGGIKGRVRRHLTSARSDIIANMQLDVWELAHVRARPETDKSKVDELERRVFHEYRSTIIAGKILRPPQSVEPLPAFSPVRILDAEEVARRRDPRVRLPRQLRHIENLLDIILNRKDSADQRRSLEAHFKRLQQQRYPEFNQLAAVAPPDQEAD